jgi:4'-phosphopantetheinyl transferase
LAACLIARHVDVGIDVEPVGRRADIDNIASHFFSSSEIELLGSTPQEKRQTVFMRLWTLKEAYLKARGTGLSTPLSHCVFDIRDENRSGVSFHQDLGDDTDQWLFRSHVRNQTHVMALAIRRSQIGQDFWIRTSVIVP